jgi:site-specific recombinase XerD
VSEEDEMARTTTQRIADVTVLAQSFARHLRAGNRSPRTVRSYLESVDQLDRFLADRGMPRDVASLRREHVESYIEDVLARYKPATAVVRFKSLQQFFRWLLEEGEITDSPMARMRPPKVPHDPPAVLNPQEVRALLKACDGNGFADRRDAAIVSLFYDTGLRLSELVTLKLTSTEVEGSDVDLDRQLVYVIGKGDRARVVGIGARSVKAIDRYLRVRGSHPDAGLPDLWLGRHGRMTQSGVQQMLRRRAAEAGIPHLNPHQFRHTFAHNYLKAGGAETNLMSLTGWQSRSMIERYAASTRAERAREEHRRLSPGDRL